MPRRIFVILGRAFAAVTIVSIAAVVPAQALFFEAVAAPSNGRTEVIVFKPVVPNAPQRQGYCWTQSVAVSRARTSRCMVGNSVEDPCFGVAEFSDAVVCGANPALSEAGFLVRLTKPLPPTDSVALPAPSPWIVELAIGQGQVPGPYAMPPPKTFCSVLTGTRPVVDGEPVPYSCWEANVQSKPQLGDTQIGLLNDFNPGKVWTVTEVMYVVSRTRGPNQPPFKLVEKKTIALERLWE